MDIRQLKPGDRVRTSEGSIAEVLKDTEDGKWILVRYVQSRDDPALAGTEDLCHEDELSEIVEAERS